MTSTPTKTTTPSKTTKTVDALESKSDAIVRTTRDVADTVASFAVGLLVGGANRLLVIAALVPTGLIATTLAERMQDASGRGRRGVQAA